MKDIQIKTAHNEVQTDMKACVTVPDPATTRTVIASLVPGLHFAPVLTTTYNRIINNKHISRTPTAAPAKNAMASVCSTLRGHPEFRLSGESLRLDQESTK